MPVKSLHSREKLSFVASEQWLQAVNYRRVIIFSTFAAAHLDGSLGYCFDNGEWENFIPFRALHRANQSNKMRIYIACQKVIMPNTELSV